MILTESYFIFYLSCCFKGSLNSIFSRSYSTHLDIVVVCTRRSVLNLNSIILYSSHLISCNQRVNTILSPSYCTLFNSLLVCTQPHHDLILSHTFCFHWNIYCQSDYNPNLIYKSCLFSSKRKITHPYSDKNCRMPKCLLWDPTSRRVPRFYVQEM